MTWNFRVIEHKTPEIWYGIHEVFYDHNAKIKNWTTDPMDVTGESVEDMRGYYETMAEAFDLPVLKIVVKRGIEKLVEVK